MYGAAKQTHVSEWPKPYNSAHPKHGSPNRFGSEQPTNSTIAAGDLHGRHSRRPQTTSCMQLPAHISDAVVKRGHQRLPRFLDAPHAGHERLGVKCPMGSSPPVSLLNVGHHVTCMAAWLKGCDVSVGKAMVLTGAEKLRANSSRICIETASEEVRWVLQTCTCVLCVHAYTHTHTGACRQEACA